VSGRLLTARELAELLGVTTETVLRWTRRGDLPAFRLPGGAIRYDRDAIHAWLREHATADGGEESADPSRHPPVAILLPGRPITTDEET
jgi:excisionase family DNA binding protein